MPKNHEDILVKAYSEFNARNIEGVLILMHPKVHWPNGWEGGYVNGHAEVRSYWVRQWQELNPVVQPVEFIENGDDKVDVIVHQVVKDTSGKLLFDGLVKHAYTFEVMLIKSMEIDNV